MEARAPQHTYPLAASTPMLGLPPSSQRYRQRALPHDFGLAAPLALRRTPLDTVSRPRAERLRVQPLREDWSGRHSVESCTGRRGTRKRFLQESVTATLLRTPTFDDCCGSGTS